jgi:peptide/nickel transport system substrate-binding protein
MNNWETSVAYNIYDGLVHVDLAKGVQPWVAESWEISEDGLTYTFRIRDGLTFHDGSPLTAEDVAFSMDRMLALAGPAASFFEGAVDPEGTKVADERTVSFKLSKPYAPFLRGLMSLRIVNKKLVMENLAAGDFGEFQDYGREFLRANAAGSGPYRLTLFAPSDRVEIEAVPDYALGTPNAARPERVSFSTTPEVATIATRLRAGEIDVGDWSLPLNVQQSIVSDDRLSMLQTPTASSWYVVMNNARAPFDDPAVRRAVSLAYDTETVVEAILGAGEPQAGPVPNDLLPACTDIKTYAFDLEAAKAELAKSKYSASELASMTINVAAVAGSERFNNIALSLVTNLTALGLKAEVTPARWTDIVQAATKRETAFGMAVFYQALRIPDPYLMLVYYTPEGWGRSYPSGGVYYGNDLVTERLEAALAASDEATQNAAYCDAVRQIAEDAPSVFSNTDVRTVTYWNYVTEAFPANGGVTFAEMRFENWAVDTSNPAYQANH